MKLTEKNKIQTQRICDSKYSTKLPDGRLLCKLCPVNCKISNGQHGKCYVRHNVDGKFQLFNYSKLVQASIDTLRKRPIYLLGNENIKSLTIGLTGCNNTCPFCQNWMVSQSENYSNSIEISPEEIIEFALKNEVNYISFTYTEPIVWIEYVSEISNLAKEKGIKCCLKTAGYISEEFGEQLLSMVDVINLDIKPLNEEYLKKCGIVDSECIWNFAKKAVLMKKHIEISHIIIEGINDSMESVSVFSRKMKELGNNIAIHLLRHYPAWKSNYCMTKDETLSSVKKHLEFEGHINVFTEDVG